MVRRADILPPARIAAYDGERLRRDLFGAIQANGLKKITIITYRFTDFDYRTVRVNENSNNRLMKLLVRAANNGTEVLFMTRDPDSEGDDGSWDKKSWVRGLLELSRCPNAQVQIHRSLHAKIYLIEFDGDRCFYSVGSSNLTVQGMGGRWSECNAVGRVRTDYDEVEKSTRIICGEQNKIQTFHQWNLKANKSLVNLAALIDSRSSSSR